MNIIIITRNIIFIYNTEIRIQCVCELINELINVFFLCFWDHIMQV